MSFFKVNGGFFLGIQFFSVEIECVHARRLPFLQIIGCSSALASELREKIRASLDSCQFRLPARRFTVKIQPNLPNFASESVELPIALALLGSIGTFPPEKLENIFIFGGLGLDGKIKSIPNSVSKQILQKYRGAILPWNNSEHLSDENLCSGGGFLHLKDVVAFLKQESAVGKKKNDFDEISVDPAPVPEISGYAVAKRLLEISAAGSHHAFFWGKELQAAQFARLLSRYLPTLNKEERSELQMNQAYLGAELSNSRPFVDVSQLCGSKSPISLSLAHHGVLYCSDRHFEKDLSLRKVMNSSLVETKVASFPAKFPAKLIAVSSSELCACGARSSEGKSCRCGIVEIRKFIQKRQKILQYFDLSLNLTFDKLQDITTDAQRMARIKKARQRMLKRGVINAKVRDGDFFQFPWEPEAKSIWKKVARKDVSADSLARVSLTICDLREGSAVAVSDVMEAQHFRHQDFDF